MLSPLHLLHLTNFSFLAKHQRQALTTQASSFGYLDRLF
jgi:hypothetical protein